MTTRHQQPLTCAKCDGEGSLYTSRYGWNDPDVWRTGECPACEGSGHAPCSASGCSSLATTLNADDEALCDPCMSNWARLYGDDV